jgi:two-component system sensor histidine kinase RegB
MTMLLGLFAIACATLLIFFHEPLPWSEEYGPMPVLPNVYMLGVWFSIALAIFFISIYAWQISEESRQLVNALAATELVLAREQHLTQIDGLAAAAAHALGTPCHHSLIAGVQLAIKPDSEHAEDVRLLNEQAKRCRAILSKLTELSSGDPFDRMKLSTLIEEVVAPHRDFGVAIDVALSTGGTAEPVGGRNPAILYGLGNLLENAVDFAHERVEVAAAWSGQEVAVTITDDGPLRPGDRRTVGAYVTGRRRPGQRKDTDAGYRRSRLASS